MSKKREFYSMLISKTVEEVAKKFVRKKSYLQKCGRNIEFSTSITVAFNFFSHKLCDFFSGVEISIKF
jgi:hypothetical protein